MDSSGEIGGGCCEEEREMRGARLRDKESREIFLFNLIYDGYHLRRRSRYQILEEKKQS